MTGPIGARVWVVPGGHVPFPAHGAEPAFTGFDQLCVLNAGDDDAELTLDFYYEDAEPVGPYRLPVAARRVRHVRVNDLIDPEAVRLDRPYGCVLRSPVPVVVQFLRQDTRLPGVLALTGTMAYPADGSTG
ncbi:sensory rhodopsin transducer [Micromonospora sp. RP3T]|uniref:sensory rhodopsin transducer n=1 Tax=Micromonospora sp. RP3T TaxID=2135446 RepID=UPI003D7208FD